MNGVKWLFAAAVSVVLLASNLVAAGSSEAAQEDCTDWPTWAGDSIPITDPRCAMSSSDPVTAKPASTQQAFAVLVEWQPVTTNAHRLKYYRVFTSPPSEGEDYWNDPAPACPQTTATGCIVRGLDPGEHQFWVQAIPYAGSVTVSGPSNSISLPFKTVKRSKYQQYVELTTATLTRFRDSQGDPNLELGYQIYTNPAGLRLQAKNGRAVCRYLKRSKKGGISGREINNASDIIWDNFRKDVDLMTGEGLPLDDIKGVLQMSDASLGTATAIYCPKYTSLYFDRISPALAREYDRYVG